MRVILNYKSSTDSVKKINENLLFKTQVEEGVITFFSTLFYVWKCYKKIFHL